MKYKLLISSQHSTIVRDFFASSHEAFICLSTTEYWEDISRHFAMFEPHAYVSVFEHKDAQQLALYKSLKKIKTAAINKRKINKIDIFNLSEILITSFI